MKHLSEQDDIEFEAKFSGKEEAQIRTRLIALQEKIREANIPVIVLLCGSWDCTPTNVRMSRKTPSSSAVTGATHR